MSDGKSSSAVPKGILDVLLGPVVGPPKKSKRKKQRSDAAFPMFDFQMQSSWKEGNEANFVMDSTRHDRSDLARLPPSLPMSILGMKGDDVAKSKRRAERRRKPNPIPREKRVFTRCPDCNTQIHVRNVY